MKRNHPMDKEYLQKVAEAIEEKMPDNHGFIALAGPFNAPNGRVVYVSNMAREDALKILKQFLYHAGAKEEWMQHIK